MSIEEGFQTLMFDLYNAIIEDDKTSVNNQYITSMTQYDIYKNIYYLGGDPKNR
jgi:hypothetical protein